MSKPRKGTLYPDQINGKYYTAEEIVSAQYVDHLMDHDSWMVLLLRNNETAVVASIDVEDAEKETGDE
jgi:hypothetical protein